VVAIDPAKLLSDIKTADDDMKILAMRTLKSLNEVVVSRNVQIILEIQSELEVMLEEGCDEIRFFAQESLDFLADYDDILTAVPVPSLSGEKALPSSGKSGFSSSSSQSVSTVIKPGATGLEDKSDKALRFLAKGTSNPSLAISALKVLSANVQVRHLPVIIKYLRFNVPQVRLAAVKAIQAAGDERSLLQALLPHLNDRSQEVRDTCLKAIIAIDPKSLLTGVETMIHSSQISVKVAAVFILAHMDGDEVVHLLEMAAHDKNEEVRSRVVDALKGRKGWDTLAILKLLVNDLDIDVAEKALVLYEKLKTVEGVENSSLELGDIIKEKLNEINAQQEDSEENEDFYDVSGLPGASGDRIKIGEKTNQMQQHAVPKKIITPSRHKNNEDKTSDEHTSDSEHTSDDVTDDSLKPLSEYPEDVQLMSDEIFDRLDSVLEDMGRKIWQLEKSNRISNRRFSKIVYDIQKYEDMLSKRAERYGSKDGFFAKLSAGNRMIQEKQQLSLEFSLAELYRKLGEIAVEISISEEDRFVELEDFYVMVEGLLSEVHNVKEMHEL
jgi:HEAT repeat protein